MSFEKQSLMPYSVTPCYLFCIVSFFNFFDQVLPKNQCDPVTQDTSTCVCVCVCVYICMYCIYEHVLVCVSETEITKPYSLTTDSDLFYYVKEYLS